MVTEDKKYVSGVSRNSGFALLTPTGAIVFQYLVFNKGLLTGHILISLLLALCGLLFLYHGYNIVKERNK